MVLELPSLILMREIKSVSTTGVSVVEVSERLIFNRCAPLAAKLLVHVELSNRPVLDSGVMIFSVTLKPTVPV